MAKEGDNLRDLLKWRLFTHTDGTNTSRNLNEFKEAIRSETLDKRIKDMKLVLEATEQVLESQGITPDDIEDLLDELQEHVESIGMANYLDLIGGVVPLIGYLKHSHANVKAKAAEVVSTIVQNNKRNRQLVMKANGLDLLLSNFTSDPDIVVRTKALGAIASLIRYNMHGINAFRMANGYAGLRDALSSENNKFQRKALGLFHHLLEHDIDIDAELRSPGILTHPASSGDPEAALTKPDSTNLTEEDKLKQITRKRFMIRIREIVKEKEGRNWNEKKGEETDGKSDDVRGQQGGQEEGFWILFCAKSLGCDDRVDFYLVDLKRDAVYCNVLPSMYVCVGMVEMLSAGSFIYLLTGAHAVVNQPLASETAYYYHKGASCLDLGGNSNCWCWEPTAIPDTTSPIPSFCSLFGNLYCFGYPYPKPPQVYHGRCGIAGQWKELEGSLPSHVVGSRVSFPVLSDPANHRILVRLKGGGGHNHLYAFYPRKEDMDGDHSSSGGEWVCITTEMYTWAEEVMTIADDIIYFYSSEFSSIFRAYDIASRKWLTVVWSSVCIDDVYIKIYQFDALFSCPGKGMLCLAVWNHFFTEPVCTTVGFLRFRVKRTSDSSITLTPLAFQSYRLASISNILDFLAL